MSVYHQIGHNSMNLVNEQQLHQYVGMVCSPLNYTRNDIMLQIEQLPHSFISIFDPQLYFPQSERGNLRSWDYFPDNFDTADQSSIVWWGEMCDKLIDTCGYIGCKVLCSPSIVPAMYSPDYYDFSVDIANLLYEKSKINKQQIYQTAIIDFNSIGEDNQPEIISSVLSKTESETIYLIIKSDVEPRRELSVNKSLLGVMILIHLLKNCGLNIFIPFCSSEFILWKYAGARMFATGKFFNLRRFTSSRFGEPTGGGGQLPYWFERNLMAYLREGDLIRIKSARLLHDDYLQNPYSTQIISQIENSPGSAWLGLSWKNYLYTFAELEKSMNNRKLINELLIRAEKNWGHVDKEGILMEEVRNNGEWIRLWRITINDFNKYLNETKN